MASNPELCPIHAKPLVTHCPICIGSKGGKASTPAKRAAAQANATKPRPRLDRWPIKTPLHGGAVAAGMLGRPWYRYRCELGHQYASPRPDPWCSECVRRICESIERLAKPRPRARKTTEGK